MAAQAGPDGSPKPTRRQIPEHQQPNALARTIRWTILVAVWALITFVAVQHQRLGGGPQGAPPVDALCPFGGLETLYQLVAGGEFLRRIFPSAIVLLIGTLLSALLLRRAFCGWICPLGAMQELFGAIGRRLKWRRRLTENAADRHGRLLKYLVLVLILAATWKTGELVFRPFDPWAAYAHLSAGWASVRDEFLVGFVVLVVTVLGSVLLERSWCRYLCPLGGFLGLVSRAGATCVAREESTCIHCGRCDRACPVDLKVQSVDVVRSPECLACGECTAVCPVPNTLSFRLARRRVSNLVVGVLAIVIFFGAVATAKGLGVWQSRPSSLGEIVGTGEARSPENIRGFMTLQQIADLFGLEADRLREAAGLPPGTALDQPVKAIMAAAGREPEEIREVVKSLLASAPGQSAAPAPGASPQDISGMDTLADLQKRFGVPPAAVLKALQLPADTPQDKALREIMRPLGRHVTEVRSAVEQWQGAGQTTKPTTGASQP